MERRGMYAARGDVKRRPNGAALVDALIRALRGRGWVSASRLTTELGTDARSIREAANRSGGQVVSGQQGYRMTRETPGPELDRAIARFYSQAREMSRRGRELERVRSAGAGVGDLLELS